MPQNDPSRTPSFKDVSSLLVMLAGACLFLTGFWRGMSIDPRYDMHGRHVAYALGVGGLTMLVGAVCVTATNRVARAIYGIATAVSLVLFIHEMALVL